MGTAIHRTTLQFRTSVNNPDFPEPTWKWNPDMSQVGGVPIVHQKWNAVAERPEPMTQAEMDAVDAAAVNAAKDEVESQIDGTGYDLDRALSLVMLDEINALRSNAGLSARTTAQLKAAIRSKL